MEKKRGRRGGKVEEGEAKRNGEKEETAKRTREKAKKRTGGRSDKKEREEVAKQMSKKSRRIWFDLVGFYCMSTSIGYLMLNPVGTHILDIYDL